MALSPSSRDFFALISDAAFANPFSDERARIDRRIVGASKGADRAETIVRLTAMVHEKLRDLEPIQLARHAVEDRALLEQAVLFDVFHRYSDPFDALIQEQLARGAKSVRVSFGREALQEMVRVGLEPAAARRYFAFFYQLRRAFFFIERSLPGSSASMRALRERLWANVFTSDPRLYARVLWQRMEDFSTLLLGETGTGKGAAASAIGRSGWIPYDEKSDTFEESFVQSFHSVNLSQFPEALIESELFGHRKGAFTGAVDGHDGVFARCSPHGAIFLDEIGEVGVPTQIKLLRVLQDRTFSPVGGHETLRFAGRVVAATNRSLDAMRERGQFRDDFFYRLCSDVIEMPSLGARLREDPGELDALLRVIVTRILGVASPETEARVRAAIDRDLGPEYAWPGNVRELEQCVRRVVLTRGYAGDRRTRPAPDGARDAHARLLEVVGEETAQGLVARYCRALHARHGTYEEVARRTGLDRRTVKAQMGKP
jgi:DNA-binding NtrC family response regulator